MMILYNVIEFLVSFVETYLCYLFMNLIFRNRIESKKKELIVLFYSLGISICIFLNNQISLFSNFLLLFVIFAIGISSPLLFKTTFAKGITIVGIYYLAISLFDLFLMFVISIFTKEENIGDYLLSAPGMYRSIYICIVKLCLILLYVLVRNSDIKYAIFYRYWIFWLIICIIGYSALFYFQQFALGSLTKILASNWLLFLAIFIMILLLFYMYTKYRDYKEKNIVINVRNESLEKSYAHIQRLYKDNEHVMHDFKNHIAIIANYIKKEENEKALKYIDNIVQSVRKIENTVWSGIEIIDIILNCKMAEAETYHIQMDIDIIILPSKVTDMDFCTILSNLLDNAIESSIKDVEENRYIKVSMKSINNMLSIRVKNNIVDKPRLTENFKFETTKSDKKGHGIGLDSVKCCVNKYEGNIQFYFGKNDFEVKILLLSV